MPDPWPLQHLVLRTPRLTLRPDDDEGLHELAFGTEMRAAVLLLAFDHLGAVRARSGAFTDNPASLRISEKLGYRRDGTGTHPRRGEVATEIRLALEPPRFVRPEWTLTVEGLDGCRALLGAG